MQGQQSEQTMEISIAPSGWTPPTIRPNIYPHATPAKIATPDVMIYLIDVRSNQINDNTDELANAISVEKLRQEFHNEEPRRRRLIKRSESL